jgi:hypothetical protein
LWCTENARNALNKKCVNQYGLIFRWKLKFGLELFLNRIILSVLQLNIKNKHRFRPADFFLEKSAGCEDIGKWYRA